jgi:hypothetical protein
MDTEIDHSRKPLKGYACAADRFGTSQNIPPACMNSIMSTIYARVKNKLVVY